MMALLIAAAAASVGGPPPSPAAAQWSGEARTVVEAQLRTLPRTGAEAGLGADEADAVFKRYIDSIGRTLDRGQDGKPR
jgi:hypothetical protein